MVQHHNFYAASPFSTPLHACMVHSRAMAWCAQAKVKSKVWLPLHQNHDETKHHPTLMKPSNYTSYPIMPMTMKPLTHNIYIYIYTYTQSGTGYFYDAYYEQCCHSKGPYLGTFISIDAQMGCFPSAISGVHIFNIR